MRANAIKGVALLTIIGVASLPPGRYHFSPSVISGKIKYGDTMCVQDIKELETSHPCQTGRLTKGKPARLEIVNGANDSHLMGHCLRMFTKREKKVIGDIDRNP
jgi:hypothetical protein